MPINTIINTCYTLHRLVSSLHHANLGVGLCSPLLEHDGAVPFEVAEVNTGTPAPHVGMLANQEPAHVREEEAPARVVRVGVSVGELVVHAVVPHPLVDVVLQHKMREAVSPDLRGRDPGPTMRGRVIIINNEKGGRPTSLMDTPLIRPDLVTLTWKARVWHSMRKTRSGSLAL